MGVANLLSPQCEIRDCMVADTSGTAGRGRAMIHVPHLIVQR